MRYYGDAVQFENEDVAYRAWIDGNAHGFVVNSCAKPSPDYLKMHRACCPSISRPDRDIWTSGQYIKTCSADRASLESWARDHVLGTCTSGCHCMGGRAGQAAVVSPIHAREEAVARQRSAVVGADPGRAPTALKTHVRDGVAAARRAQASLETRGPMPEAAVVAGVTNPLDRILLLTLCASVDRMRDSELWYHQAKALYERPSTAWLFVPDEVVGRDARAVHGALESVGALRFRDDANWWVHNATTWQTEYGGDPRSLLSDADHDGPAILRAIRRKGAGGSRRFYGLGGPKIGPMWLRFLIDVEDMPIRDMESVPIAVDVHIARATFAAGLLRGSHDGSLTRLRARIQDAWAEAATAAGTCPLSFDAALWRLSRDGCTRRPRDRSSDCPARRTCAIGSTCPKGIIDVTSKHVRVRT